MSTTTPEIILTADVVLFAQRDGDLHVLVIERGGPPYQGSWALPGGYLDPGETFKTAACRELTEETGLTAPADVIEVGVFDDPHRDPRGRVISVAYTAVLADVVMPTAGDDARDARWAKVQDLLDKPTALAFDHHRILAAAVGRLFG